MPCQSRRGAKQRAGGQGGLAYRRHRTGQWLAPAHAPARVGAPARAASRHPLMLVALPRRPHSSRMQEPHEPMSPAVAPDTAPSMHPPRPRMREPSVTTIASTFSCGQFHTMEACGWVDGGGRVGWGLGEGSRGLSGSAGVLGGATRVWPSREAAPVGRWPGAINQQDELGKVYPSLEGVGTGAQERPAYHLAAVVGREVHASGSAVQLVVIHAGPAHGGGCGAQGGEGQNN